MTKRTDVTEIEQERMLQSLGSILPYSHNLTIAILPAICQTVHCYQKTYSIMFGLSGDSRPPIALCALCHKMMMELGSTPPYTNMIKEKNL